MSSPPSLQAFHPTTFLERGVAVPFTTPTLAGARARPSERCGIELIIPNPSGARGAYVLPWTAIREYGRPTVHDLQLNERIAGLRSVTPGAIRKASRTVSRAGLAGRAAGAAARQADEQETRAAMVTNFDLLLKLVQQVEPAVPGALRPEQERPVELERRAKRAIARIAPRLGQHPDVIATHLEEIATLLAPVGLGTEASASRLPRTLAALKLMRLEVAAWGAENDSAAIPSILATADLTLACAGEALRIAREGTGDVLALLVGWKTDAAELARRMARPDWLVDGWDQICSLWQLAARPIDRPQALHEIGLLLPIIPREAGEWVGFTIDTEAPIRFNRSVLLNEDWRTGTSVLDLIARNERVRALAA